LKFSTASKPIITVGVSSAQVPLTQIRALAEDELVQKLQLLEGVAAVDIFGGYRRSINILLDKNRLAAHKVSPH
jgi:multidrug efflux pump subunit AcrB